MKIIVFLFGAFLFLSANAELIFVQSFEKGLEPDFSILPGKTMSSVKGRFIPQNGFIADSCFLGENGLKRVEYKIGSPYGGNEGTIGFCLNKDSFKDNVALLALEGNNAQIKINGVGDSLSILIEVSSQKYKFQVPVKSFSYDRISKFYLITLSWKEGVLSIGKKIQPLKGKIPFNFKKLIIGGGASCLEGNIDEIAVYDEWINPTVRGYAFFGLTSWLPDNETQKLVENLGYELRRAEKKGYDVAYCKLAYAAAKIGAVKFRHQRLNAEQQKEHLAFIKKSCEDSLEKLKKITAGKELPLTLPRENLKNLKIKDWCYVDKQNNPVLLIQPMYEYNINCLKGITNCARLWLNSPNEKNKTIEKIRNTYLVAEEANKAILVSSFWPMSFISRKSKDEKDYCLRLTKLMETITRKDNYSPSDRAVMFNLCHYETGGGGNTGKLDYSKEAIEGFRGKLEKKYKDIDNLNFIWDTEYKSFSDIQPVAWKKGVYKILPNNRAAWYDWLDFNTGRFTMRYKKSKEIVSKYIDIPLNIIDCNQNQFKNSSGVTCYDWNEMAKINDVDLTEAFAMHPDEQKEFAIDPCVPFLTDFRLSLKKPNQALLNIEHHCVTLLCSNGKVEGRQLACHLFRELFHGQSYVGLWSAFQPWKNHVYRGRPYHMEQYAIFQHPRTSLPAIYNYYKSVLDCRRLAKYICLFRKASSDIAILYSLTTMKQTPPEEICKRSNWSEHEKSMRRFYQAMLPLGKKVEFLTDEKVDEGKCGKYKIVIIPSVSHLRMETAKKIQEYVVGGGNLIVAPDSFVFDEHHKLVNYLSGLFSLEGWFVPGAAYRVNFSEACLEPGLIEKISLAYRRNKNNLNLSPVGKYLPENETYKTDGGVVELINCRPGQKGCNILEFSKETKELGGRPALVRFPYGKGNIFYLTVPMTPETYMRILTFLMKENQIEPLIRIVDNSGNLCPYIEMRYVKYKDSIILYAINLSRKTLGNLKIKIDDKRKHKFFDLLNEKECADSISLESLACSIIKID